MPVRLLPGVLGVFWYASVPVTSEIFPERQSCKHDFTLTSVSDVRQYGLYLAAPESSSCAEVRYRIQDASARVLGQSPPLAPGQGVVVRLGRGFPTGAHALTIHVEGCDLPPRHARRVQFGKSSPDHSWRGP